MKVDIKFCERIYLQNGIRSFKDVPKVLRKNTNYWEQTLSDRWRDLTCFLDISNIKKFLFNAGNYFIDMFFSYPKYEKQSSFSMLASILEST